MNDRQRSLQDRRVAVIEALQMTANDCMSTIARMKHDGGPDDQQRVSWIRMHALPGLERKIEEAKREF